MNDEAISLSLQKRYEAAFDLLNAEIVSRDIQITLLKDLLREALRKIEELKE
jgi:predicted metal-dependent hydrolase